MRFRLEHRFDAPLERVERAILDPSFDAQLAELPNVKERSVLEHEDRPDGSVHRKVRYRLHASLPSAVTRVIGTHDVQWVEASDFDPATHTWRFEIHPDLRGVGFDCRGTITLRSQGPGTVRELSGEVKVKVPLLGGRVEKAIVEGLTENMDAESELLARFLAGRSETAS